MLKFTYFTVTIVLLFVYAYLNLGNFLDATSSPKKTDLLVCLGGGNYKIRIEKTLDVYDKDLVNSSTIVLTGYVNSNSEVKRGIIEDKRVSYIKNNTKSNIHLVLNKDLENTAKEIIYVKKYMLQNNYKSVTFITEPPHSRRILLFFSMLSVSGDENLTVTIVGADYKNWNKKSYYEDKYAKNYAFTETIKILYGLVTYGVLDKVGLLKWFEETFKDDIQDSKKSITKGMNFISS